MAMAVQAARAATQLREAARDMARVARRRAQEVADPTGGCVSVEGETPGAWRNQGPGMAGLWPLKDYLELEPHASAVPRARRSVRQALRAWGLAGAGDAAELVASELVTNSIRASSDLETSAPVRLWLLSDMRDLWILVWDSSPQPPARRDTADDAENGRGLLLVEALSTQWSWIRTQEPSGKVVWAEIRAGPQ